MYRVLAVEEEEEGGSGVSGWWAVGGFMKPKLFHFLHRNLLLNFAPPAFVPSLPLTPPPPPPPPSPPQ